MSELDELMEGADEAEEAFDLSDIDAQTLGALSAGRYAVEVVSCKRGVVKSGDGAGNPKLEIRFKSFDPASNKPIFWHRPLKGKGANITRGALDTLGIDTSQPVKPHTLVGRKAYVTLSIRKDRPTDNNIDMIEAYDGATEVGSEELA